MQRQVTVRFMQIDLFKLAGSRQEDIRVTGGVGLEELVNDGEEVLTLQAFCNFRTLLERGIQRLCPTSASRLCYTSIRHQQYHTDQ